MPQDSDDTDQRMRDALLLAQQAIAQSLVLAMQNAVAAQQMMNTLTVALAARAAGQSSAEPDAGLRAALDVLRGQDPMAQMTQLAALIEQMKRTMAPLSEAPPA